MQQQAKEVAAEKEISEARCRMEYTWTWPIFLEDTVDRVKVVVLDIFFKGLI